MENIIYKTVQDCVNLEVSKSVFIEFGEGYSCEDEFTSPYFSITRFSPKDRFWYCTRNTSCRTTKVYKHLVKAVSRRGLSAEIKHEYGNVGSPNGCWGEYKIKPTFEVDGVLCVYLYQENDMYVFLPIQYFEEYCKNCRGIYATRMSGNDEYWDDENEY